MIDESDYSDMSREELLKFLDALCYVRCYECPRTYEPDFMCRHAANEICRCNNALVRGDFSLGDRQGLKETMRIFNTPAECQGLCDRTGNHEMGCVIEYLMWKMDRGTDLDYLDFNKKPFVP